MKPFSKTALIIGAGPAGLTAAYELLARTDTKPVVFESLDVYGGLSATYRYKGNGIDVGGHRLFSKNDAIVSWWKQILPLQSRPSIDDIVLKRDRSRLFGPGNHDPELTDALLLVRDRLSSIYFNHHLFDYPLNTSFDTFRKLGVGLSFRIVSDFLLNRLHPRNQEKTLEDFFINRFGRTLYETFFKSYTEKVWGISCREIGREWGVQRVKGISIGEIARQWLFQKTNEPSLTRHFYYPKLGIGQLWEEVARRIIAAGGEIHKNTTVTELHIENGFVKKVFATTGHGPVTFSPDYVFSSMPIKDLITAIKPSPPHEVRAISSDLPYRDFIMTGILAKNMRQGKLDPVFPGVRLLPDTWVYIQEPAVLSGRLQVFNNWSPYLLASRNTAWVGLEFFCKEGDTLWGKSESDIVATATGELDAMNLVSASDVIDGFSIAVKKAYPAYHGSYSKLGIVKKYVCGLPNLFCIGRNGLHRYNNIDHSMLTAMKSVNILSADQAARESVWDINSENEYGEAE
jgi:protoporphyrinogen oxidase